MMNVGRKATLAVAAFGAPFLVASVALFAGYATFDQWSGFVSVQAPLVLGMYSGANVANKVMAKLKDGHAEVAQ